ncbi:MAG: CinA family protein [Clostridia bacterium]|nr:CinA family protein [Clostridia bacterium]
MSNCCEYDGVICNSNAVRLVKLLSDRHLKIAFAESLTGGMLTSMLVDVPGSSSVLDGSVVSYSNDVKMSKLKVPESVLNSVGAVSAECAVYMAAGVLQLMLSDFAVSVTGIAGPGGEEPGKPVGTVFIGLADKSGFNKSYRFVFEGNRTDVRKATCDKAMELILSHIENL